MRRLFRRRKNLNDRPRYVNPGGTANVFSYYANRTRAEANTGRRQELSTRRQFAMPGRAGKTLLMTGLVITLLGYSVWIDVNPRIEIVPKATGDANLLQPRTIYQKAGKDLLSESIMSRTKLTVDTAAIEREFKGRFPEIEEIAIAMPINSRKPLFKIQPATPALLLVSSSGGNYAVDGRGIAVTEVSGTPNIQRLKLPSVTDESGLEVHIGKAVLPQDSLAFITSVIAQLKAQNIDAKALSLPTVANELHFHVAGEGYYVKFNTAGNPRLQAGALIAVRKRLQADHKKPAEYIDVRIHDKVFYK